MNFFGCKKVKSRLYRRIFSIIVFMLCGIFGSCGRAGQASASEIFGILTTDPANPGAQTATEQTGSGSASPSASNPAPSNPPKAPTVFKPIQPAATGTPAAKAAKATSTIIKKILPQRKAKILESETAEAPEEEAEVKVLGYFGIKDSTLVRDERMRIYQIRGQTKRYISSLEKLKRFSGQPIYPVNSEQISGYALLGHLEGDLVRVFGQSAVYLVLDCGLLRIKSPDELWKKYPGREISGISREELLGYL